MLTTRSTLSAEIGVAGRIDDVDHDVAVLDAGVLGQDGDSALPFLRVRVHDQIGDLLIGAEDVAIAQHGVDEARLAVVDVRDDGDVAEMGLGRFSHIPSGLLLTWSGVRLGGRRYSESGCNGFESGFPHT